MARKAPQTDARGVDRRAASAGGWWEALALGAGLPFVVAVVLYRLKVPLGKPKQFVYEYSPIVLERLGSVPVALLLAAAVAGGVWLTLAARRGRRRVGLALLAAGLGALALWSYLAPPEHLQQHVFNMHSPSQDGAFLREALRIDGLRAYLRAFPQRARTPPEEMKGTRVVSNPPGTTVLACAVCGLVESHQPLAEYLRRQIDVPDPELAEFRHQAALGLALSWVLTALWLVSGLPLYAIGRLFFPPAGAATFAVCCLVSPMTLLFTPGKDPAQLLTVATGLWLWLLAVRRGWWWAAAASGAVFVLACMVSLVHVWVAAVVAVPSAWLAPGGLRRLALRGLLPAALGATAAAAALYAGGLNVFATAWAVAQSQAEVTRGAGAMPLRWQLLGVPLFLLFAGPGLWTSTLWLLPARKDTRRRREEDARFGRYLLICCVVVLAATVGFTNIETPRLWIPFVPLLLLGAGLQLGVFRPAGEREGRLLATLVLAQIAISVLHWALMDMRTAELRLTQGVFYG